MAMRAPNVEAPALFPKADDLSTLPTVPFFDKLSEVPAQVGYDAFVADICNPYCATQMGRPSLALGGQGTRWRAGT